MSHPDNDLEDWKPRKSDLSQAFDTIKSEILHDSNKPFRSTHGLDFMCCPWPVNPEYISFKVGTCRGIYTDTGSSYSILAISNDELGNGHFTDVMEFFERSCRRDKKSLVFQELMNPRFAKYLKRNGFKSYAKNDMIKHFK